MQDRANTIIGWVLFGFIVALGGSIVSGMYFAGDRPDTMGYPIEGVEEEGGASGPSFAVLLASADVAAGEQVFRKCAACHTIDAGGADGLGPNIHGSVGAPKASGSFNYSAALRGVGGSWDFEALDAWLQSPRRFAPGTTMSFAGLGSAEERANLVAYMNSQGSNLPLPAAPPPEAAGDTAAGNEAEIADPADPDAQSDAGAQTPTADPDTIEQSATGSTGTNPN